MIIVKISDELHEEVRKTSKVMERSMNTQAEFWIKTPDEIQLMHESGRLLA